MNYEFLMLNGIGLVKNYSVIFFVMVFILFANCKVKVADNSIPLLKLFIDLATTEKVGKPTFDPPAGTYNKDQLVTVNTSVSGTTIYYTTDGSKPTTASAQYTGAIPVTGHGTTNTIQAMAIRSGMSGSDIASETYVINYDAVAMPTLNPAAGTYASAQTVALSTTTAGATIYYTLDGTTPTASSTQYTGAISLSVGGSTTTIQAIAIKSGMANSSVANGTYWMNFVPISTFSPLPGVYGSDQSVTINGTAGATIYYTLDDSTPTPSSLQYTTPISIAGNGTRKTIKALAVKSGIPNSPVASGTWTIDTTLPLVSINSVIPNTTIDGATNPQINWQATQAGTYSVRIGGTSCADGTLATGTNISGSNLVNNAITTTVNSSNLLSDTNIIRFCVQNVLGNYGYVTQSIIKDDVAPLAGNSGTITTASVTSTSLTLNWTKATDNYTAQTSLQYKVVKSLSNNIDTVANGEANGTIVQNWTLDINTLNVTGLIANTAYYFNVLAKDSVENKGLYVIKQSNAETYSWGTFTDNFNGTVSFVGAESYSGQNLTWMKCSQGQTWNSGTNICEGTAGIYQFCTTADNNCNGGVTTNELGVGGFLGGSTSAAYNQCNSIGTYAGKTGWRVPKKDELKTLIHCTDKTMPVVFYPCQIGNYMAPAINNLFPNTIASYYLSSTTYMIGITYAWYVSFLDGEVSGSSKIGSYNMRCVSGP
ncbi:MAG: chitobiase/beta-hexosaminidase C-terminal domain-containing protein [Leptospiraceae bacterium]|nr:chitobiase/beta-hexosaminidase C-terminal domain-containing protein [Leptospiraceae bacterium]